MCSKDKAGPAAGQGTPPSRPAHMPWRFSGRLFPELSQDAANVLTGYGCLLRKAAPLRPKHFNELPFQIKTLSQALTADKGTGPPPGYLSDDKYLSAYSWYFLPWNLYRLTRLLSGLPLDLPDGAAILDLGAGPLTFVQALWLARPDLRAKNLRFTCVDSSQKAMRLGAALFDLIREETLAGGIEEARGAWSVSLVRGQLRKPPAFGANLVVAANVINELHFTRSGTLGDRMDMVAETLAGAAGADGKLLVIEPGVRSSGKMLARLRDSFTDMGLALLAPCPHEGPCPLDGGKLKSWCHFSAKTDSAPQWLSELSRLAGLPKRAASLSFLLAGAPGSADAGRSPGLTRIVSNMFKPEGGPGPEARYGCFSGGLGLLLANEPAGLLSGDLLEASWPKNPARDVKSGAARVLLERGAPKKALPPEETLPVVTAKSCPAPCVGQAAGTGRGQRTGGGKFPSGRRPGKPGMRRTDKRAGGEGRGTRTRTGAPGEAGRDEREPGDARDGEIRDGRGPSKKRGASGKRPKSS